MAMVPKPSGSLVDATRAMPPPPARKIKQIILDEDTFVDRISSIVERDFYPAIPALESVLHGEPMRKKPKFSGIQSVGQRSAQRPGHSTPSNWEDDDDEPGGLASRSDGASVSSAASVYGGSDKTKTISAEDMTLDHFTATHTSEEIDDFEKIIAVDREKTARKYFWLDRAQQQGQDLLLLKMAPEDERNPKRDGVTDAWKYQARNLLMYTPLGDDVKQPELSAGPAKVIVYENTRFPGGFFNAPSSDPNEYTDVVRTPAYDDTVAVSVSGTPLVGGYKLMRTPTIVPGDTGESPLMTWGDIAGTPLHLDDEDREVSVTRGFKVPATPARDLLGQKLAESARSKADARQHRSRNTGRGVTPSPFLDSGKSPRPQTPLLSAAAQRLLKGTLGGASALSRPDNQLRASYSPSPLVKNTGGRMSTGPIFAAGGTPKLNSTPKM